MIVSLNFRKQITWKHNLESKLTWKQDFKVGNTNKLENFTVKLKICYELRNNTLNSETPL